MSDAERPEIAALLFTARIASPRVPGVWLVIARLARRLRPKTNP